MLRRLLGSLALTGAAWACPIPARAQLPIAPPLPPELLTPPVLVQSPEPEYPEAAKAEGAGGTVTLELELDEQGTVMEARVLEGLGQALDAAALDVATKLRFEPARRGGVPIRSRIRFPVVFRLPRPAAAASATAPLTEAPSPEAPPPAAAGGQVAPTTNIGPTAPPVVDVNVKGQQSDAERLQQSADAVHVVELRRARERSADLGEVLAKTEGVVVRRDGGLGSTERFSLNGLYDEQVRVFLDGVPLELQGYTFGIASMPVNLVERVEIYRGVVPIRLGADALGGAVNLVSDHDYRTHAGASYQVGSFGTQRATLSGRYHRQPGGFVLGATAFVDRAKNDYEVDVQVPDPEGQLSTARVPRFHDGYGAFGGNLETGVVERPWAKRLLLRGFFASSEKQLQHNVVMTVPYGEVHYGSKVYGTTARYELEPTRNVSLDAVAAYSRRVTHFEDHGRWVYDWFGRRIRERRMPGEIDGKPRDQWTWQHSVFGRVGARWHAQAGHTFSVSSSLSYVTRTGDERLQADPAARDPLNARQRLLTLVSGIEYETNLLGDRLKNVAFVKDYLYRAKGEQPQVGGTVERRNVKRHREGAGDALRWRFWPWLYAKASYELATRLPSADELFGDGVLVEPNVGLDPELSHNANLGPRLELKRTPVGDFVAEVTAFLRDSNHLVVLLGNDRAFAYQNVYHARTLGLENQLAWTSPKRHVALDGNLTWLDSRNVSSRGTFGAFEGDRIPNRPYLTASWGARLRFGGLPDDDDTLEPFYGGRYVHGFYRSWESQGLKAFKQVVDAQLLHTAGVTWSLSEPFGRLTATVEADNVTNAKAYDNFGVQRPGRAFSLKLTAEL